MNSTSEPAGGEERRLYVGWSVQGHARPVGLLKLLRQGVTERCEFAYGRQYLRLDDAQAVHPLRLPLLEKTFAFGPTARRDGGALPLSFQDALPDSWGRRVLEARYGAPLDDVDALRLTNDDRVGALVFADALPLADSPGATESLHSLDDVAEASRRFEAGFDTTPQMRELLRGGGSIGGARPKATFVHDGARYIAKFASRADDCDMETVEAATLGLARACGIDVPDWHLAPLSRGHALLVRRFDREGPLQNERRLHYLSCGALLDVPYLSSAGSYAEFAQTLRRISAQPERDLQELFRRLVFNLAVGNSDDHVKNHGVLHVGGGQWRLSPAFDMAPQLVGHTEYQQLALMPDGRRDASLPLALEAAPYFTLSPAAASDIAARVLDTVGAHADTQVRAHGGDPGLTERVGRFIARRIERIRTA